MRLLEAILDANQRALAGDAGAGLHPDDFQDGLPLAALTCIDARLNALFPGVLGLPKEKFIWLRNAGNIITGPLSSTMRSLALACAVKGAKEIAVIGHNDCLVCKTSTTNLTAAFAALGIERGALPPNLTEYFGLFASERQNVIKAADFIRRSPIIGPRIPVHGLMVDLETGRLEWIVNGYQTLGTAAAPATPSLVATASREFEALGNFVEFKMGEMKFPESKIGEAAAPAVSATTVVPAMPASPAPAREMRPPRPRPDAPPPGALSPEPPPLAVPAGKAPPPLRVLPGITVRKWKK